MKMRAGVLFLLIIASVLMQQYLGFDLLDTLLVLGAVYIIFFWVFNFLLQRAFETKMHPDTYVKMNRLKAAYAGRGTKGQAAGKLNAAVGLLDQGKGEAAEEEVADITARIEYLSPSIQHLYKIVAGTAALYRQDVRAAEKALARSTLDSQIQAPQKREVAFARALLYLTMRDKVRAEEQVARLNEPKNNRDQLKRLYVLGWLLHLKGEREKAAKAMDPILENGQHLWFSKEAVLLKQAAEEGREYEPWTTIQE